MVVEYNNESITLNEYRLEYIWNLYINIKNEKVCLVIICSSRTNNTNADYINPEYKKRLSIRQLDYPQDIFQTGRNNVICNLPKQCMDIHQMKAIEFQRTTL